MKINKVEFSGFRSFQKSQSIDFSSLKPGLYYVTGRNEINPELEANGIGKSSLFEVVTWILFGKTSRGLKAGSLKNWDDVTNTYSGSLEIEVPNGPVSVRRVWNPNNLEISRNGGSIEVVDQKQLEEIIGWTPDLFGYAVHFSQFSDPFVKLYAAEQTELFISILKLGIWDQASERSAAFVEEYETDIVSLNNERSLLIGQVQELISTDYSAQVKLWATQHKKKVADAHNERKTVGTAIVKAKAVVLAARKGSEEIKQLKSKTEAQAIVVGVLTRECQDISKQISNLGAKTLQNKCPTCGAPLSTKHVQIELAKAREELKQKSGKFSKELEKKNKLMEEMLKSQQLEDDLIEAEKNLSASTTNYENVCRRLSTLTSEKNPFQELASLAELRGEELTTKIDNIDKDLEGINKRLGIARFWVRGYKEIRLMEIRNSLAQLTIEVNESLYQLGLRDWSVEFDVESETKAGTIKRAFSVFIKSPDVEDAVPFEVWCGGESQRLSLAISMGVANLICSRMGLQPNLEMYDEPSQHMGDLGINGFLEVLVDRAKKYNKVILLADHRALEFGGFAGAINIIKDKDGSRIWGTNEN